MYYTERLFKFLEQLAANNDRQWFAEHKQEYDELRARWLDDVQRVIDTLAINDPSFGHLRAKDCAYRIYRDTRFRTDKTPYKTFFSAAFSPQGRNHTIAGYYLHMGIDAGVDTGLYGGVWQLEPAVLRKLRHAIVDNIEEWEEIVNAPEMLRYYPDWCSSTLKTIPKGWDRNHPQAFYLRMTNYGKYHPLDRKFFYDSSWPVKAAELFEVLRPFNDFINYSIEE